jgi:hypothetical protein
MRGMKKALLIPIFVLVAAFTFAQEAKPKPAAASAHANVFPLQEGLSTHTAH